MTRRLVILLIVAAVLAPWLEASDLPPGQTLSDAFHRASGHRLELVVEMEPVAEPANAVGQRLALDRALDTLQKAGILASHEASTGIGILIESGPSVARMLAAWPGIADVRLPRYGEERMAESFAAAPGALNAGGFQGTVTAVSGGGALAGIRVSAYRQTGISTWVGAGITSTNGSGAYSFAGLAAGIYRAEFEDLTGAYEHEWFNDQAFFELSTNITVADGATTSRISVSLRAAGKISGSLSGPGGAGNVVATAWQSFAGGWRILGTAVSASNGAYTIAGLRAGAYRVKFSDPLEPPRFLDEYYNNVTDIASASSINVTSGATTGGINAFLGGYGKIAGIVTGPHGELIEGIDVDIYEYNAVYDFWEWVSYGFTGANGAYEAGGLVSRPYHLEFTDTAGWYQGEFYDNGATLETATDVQAVLGGTVSGINATLAAETASTSLPLTTGWNLVALPYWPADPSPAAVLAPIAGQFDLVYAHDACDPGDPWKKYDPNAPPFVSDLTSLTVKQGLWIRATSATSLPVSGGRVPVVTRTLCTGWNLIGYPAGTVKSLPGALGALAGKYDLVWGYQAADLADPWKKFDPAAPIFVSDLTMLGPGWGYWLRATAGSSLTIVNRIPPTVAAMPPNREAAR